MFIWMTEWDSGHVCAGIDFLFNLKSCFKCVGTKHRIDMSRLLLKIWNDDVAEKWRVDNCEADTAEWGTTGESIKYLIFSSVLTRLKVTRIHGIKIQAGGGVSRSKSELSWIITSGAQWSRPASITRKLSRQKTPGKKSPGTGKSESNWQSWNMENISYGVWRPMLCNCLSRAGLGRCRPTL